MSKDINFSNLGKVIGVAIETESEEQYKAFALDVFGEVLKNTPVDTGRARANWHIQTHRADYSLDQGQTANEMSLLNAKDLPDIYISNGLDYVEALDDGYSKQAPNGIINPALAAVRSRRG